MSLLLVILIFGFIFLLIIGSSMVVSGLRQLAKTNHTGIFALSAILLALATSFPELFVAITAALSGDASLSLGNVLGANIANVTLVTGGAALIAGRAIVMGTIVGREVLVAFVAGILPLVLGIDGQISRLDGVLLIVVWIGYVVHFFRIRFLQIAEHLVREDYWHRILHRVHVTGRRGIIRSVVGVGLLLFSGQMIVRLSTILASDNQVPLFVVGALIVAVGTTLPELIFSFRALWAGEASMFLGNILGSIIVNATLVVGIASVISPISVPVGQLGLLEGSFVIALGAFWLFVGSKHELSRAEAVILLVLYGLAVLLVAR